MNKTCQRCPLWHVFCIVQMKRRNLTLFIGVIHQKSDEEDFADIRFITMTKEEANNELIQVKQYAIKVLRLKVVIENEDYIFCQSIDETSTLESFYVERMLIIKGE